MKTLEELKAMQPRSLAGIKKLAKQYGKLDKSLKHSAALELVARQASYTNYYHAQQALK